MEMKQTAAVAVIGAGLSGLSCAQALRAAGVNVRVFESAPDVGGRCATRLWQGHLIDYGVHYFTAESVDFKKELLTRLRQFRPIISPVVDQNSLMTLNAAGPRFYVLQGNNYFAQILAKNLDVHLNTPVKTVSFTSDGVSCLGETYRAVVSSLPGPLTARLFGLAESPAEYEPSLVAMLEYAGTNVGTSRKCFGRVLGDSGEPILSSHCENNKSGRVVGDKTVFVVQATSRFSRDNADTPPEKYLPLLARENEKLWQIGNPCTASSGHLWIHGRPIEEHRHEVKLLPGAFHCGDSRATSNVENVWLDGRRAAREVLAYLAGI